MHNNVVLIQFSSRKFGNCATVSSKIAQFYQTCHIAAFTVNNQTVTPCNDCNYECLQAGKKCPNLTDAYTALMETLCRADLIYFIVPNYCGYPNANYFAFNERSAGFFNTDRAVMQKYMSIPKRFIIISNTVSKKFEDAMQQQVDCQPDILYLKSSQYGKMSIAGDIMDSNDAMEDLIAFLKRGPF